MAHHSGGRRSRFLRNLWYPFEATGYWFVLLGRLLARVGRWIKRFVLAHPLAIILAATVFTLGIGFLIKSPCLGTWDGRQYTQLCYSDVAALYEQNDVETQVPYLEGDNEYPVLTGFSMALAGLPASSYASFFVWTAVLLTPFALATAWALHRMSGWKALYFALAPTLAVYAFVNWDLIAVALAALATLAFLKNRDVTAGALLGLGAAAKLYPALLVIPFVLHRIREQRAEGGARLVAAGAGSWLVVNLPFAIIAPDRWAEFFRFNTSRFADWDSLWFQMGGESGFPGSVGTVNWLSLGLFILVTAGLMLAVAARRPAFPAWTFAFPLLIAFLLSSKVYSPQFSLWLLPWFALAFPNPWLFAVFSLSDVAVFVTRFQYFARLEGFGDGVPFEAFMAAVLVRAAVLVACVILWVRRQEPEPALVPAEVPT